MSEVLGGYGEFEVFGHEGEGRGAQVGEVGGGDGDGFGVCGEECDGPVGMAAVEGVPYVYLGYRIHGCRKTDYKAAYGPHELLSKKGTSHFFERPSEH